MMILKCHLTVVNGMSSMSVVTVYIPEKSKQLINNDKHIKPLL